MAGFLSCYADIIDTKIVENECGEKFNEFMNILKKNNVTFGEFADRKNNGGDINIENDEDNYDYESIINEINNSWDKLSAEFLEKTGLELDVIYHDSAKNGDIYDDLNGAYFCVAGGMYQLTDAGKKYKEFIKRKMFVQYR